MPKFKLSRRHMLRGMMGGTAVAVGLPMLEAMLNSNGTALAGGEPTMASDLFALAAVMYRCLTGRAVASTMQPPSAFQPDLDPRLDQVLAHALHAEPSNRLSPRRLRAELERIRSVPMILVSRLDLADPEPRPVIYGDPMMRVNAVPTA